MSDICSLCLSGDRKLFTTSDKHWQLFFTSLELDEIEYFQYLQSEHLLKICWECHARIKNFSLFVKRSQENVKIYKAYFQCLSGYFQYLQSEHLLKICWECHARIKNFSLFVKRSQENVKIYKAYFQCLSGVPPTSESRLQITKMYIIEVSPSLYIDRGASRSKLTENEEESSGQSTLHHAVKVEFNISKDEIDDTPTSNNVCEVKIENNIAEIDNYVDIDRFDSTEPAAACASDDDSGDRPLIEISHTNRTKEPIKKKLRTKTNTTKKKLKLPVTRKSRAHPKCTVIWMSNEQAQQCYTKERDGERASNPSLIHTCDACDRSFDSEASLKTHIEDFHNEEAGQLTCNMCLYRFKDQRILKQHVENHYIIYKCKQCTFETRLLNLVRDHSKNEHEFDNDISKKKRLEDVKIYKCSRCKTVFASMILLKKHRPKCSLYKCEHCDKTFKYNPSYYEHLKTHRPTINESLIYCQVCDTYFKSAKWYKQHFMKSLKHVSRDDFKHECEHCGMKFPIPRRLQEHIGSIHLKTGIYQCELCPKSYMTKGMLVRHRAAQHNLGKIGKPKDKICDVCGKGFTSNHLLNNHMRSHTGEKPFKCEYCPAAFAQSGTLYTHSKVVHKKRISKAGHADSDRYRCEVCSKDFGTDARRRVHYEFYHLKNAKFSCQICDKNFISSTSLKNHNATRHGLLTNKTYSCDTCGKKFNSASAKCQHLKTHSTERQLKCRSCDAAFRNTGALYMHYKLKHLKLKRGDRVRIKNLCKSDEEIIVNRDMSS